MKQNKECRYPECAEREEYCCHFRAVCCQHHSFVEEQNRKQDSLAVNNSSVINPFAY